MSLRQELQASKTADFSARLDTKDAGEVVVKVLAPDDPKPLFEATLPVSRAAATTDNTVCKNLCCAVRPVTTAALSKEQAAVYLMARSLLGRQQRLSGRLRLVRQKDATVVWQHDITLELNAFAVAAQRVSLPVDRMNPGQYAVEWMPDLDAKDGLVRTELEYTPMNLAQLRGMVKSPAARNVLAKFDCPVPRDTADLALLQARIDRLVDRLERQTVLKQNDITPGTLNAYREMMEVVSTLRTGKDYCSAQRGIFETAFFSPVDGSAQPFSLYVPADYDRNGKKTYQLIVHLHGSGSTHRRDGSMATDTGDAIVLSVFGRGRFYGYGPISADEVIRETREVMRRYRIDPNGVHLEGGSMGGFGCFLVATTYPDMWATAVPMCGGGINMALEQTIDLPMFVHHGLADNTVNVQHSTFSVAEMRRFGCPVQMYLYPGIGHEVGTEARKIARWDTLRNIRRDPEPHRVILSGPGIPALKKAYWLSIVRYADIHRHAPRGGGFRCPKPPGARHGQRLDAEGCPAVQVG